MTVAAIALPAAYITGANVLGPRLGFESVAVAWAVGYPIAFCLLIYLASHTLGWSVLAYARAVGGVAACMVVAGGAGAGMRAVVLDMPPALRLGVTAATIVLVAGMLLAYTQGISLRTALRALKDPPQDAT
jgi:hypothetical protein